MDNRVATDNIIDTTISHNRGSKLLDNVTLNNSHTTWNNSANKVHSQINVCVLINVEHILVKDSSQVPRNKSVNIFHQNIRDLGNKSNELYCHLHHNLSYILCLSEHHLSEPKLQLIHLTNYSLGANYCRKTFLKGAVSIFVYRKVKYTTINIGEYNIDKDIEACTIQLNSKFNKLCILTIYKSLRGNFTNFLNQLDLILQKLYGNKYNIVICADVNVNYLIDNNRRSQLDNNNNNIIIFYV
jgi:hypothetical protein